MLLPLHRQALTAGLCAWVAASYQPGAAGAGADNKTKPGISVRASPTVGFSPARIVLTAEIKGGADDYEPFYCASVEWEWGDDTRSESRADCEPYEAGKSEIKRRFVTEHVFQTSGEYRVRFRLKQKDKVVGAGSTDVKVRPGIRDGAYDR
jgi:hypothetical protein